MDLVLKISIVAGCLVAVLSLATSCVFFVRWALKRERGQQSTSDTIKRYGERIDDTLHILEEHCKNEALHVNARLQEHLLAEDRDWKRRVEGKLDDLTKGK